MKNISPNIIALQTKYVVGFSQEMSLAENKTFELWQRFRAQSKEVVNRVSSDFISLQEYPQNYLQEFSPIKKFTKWACVEVSDARLIPDKMSSFIIPKGLYAVFNYVGTPADPVIFQYIYGEWVPNSDYKLDDRPHFEVLGDKYKPNDPTSEEEIWIPITTK